MAKYSQEFKLNIIEEIEENKFSIKEIANIYGIPKITIDKWYDSYTTHGQDGLGRQTLNNKETVQMPSEKSLEEEFQIKVMEDMKNNNLSKLEIFKRYNVGMAQIALWQRKYLEDEDSQNKDIKSLLKEIKNVKKNDIQKDNNIDVNMLLKENKRLKLENSYLRKINGLMKK